METYGVGDFLAGVPDNNGWQMWDMVPLADHDITDVRARSGSQSVRAWGSADLVHGELTAPVTSGVWEGSVWQYIADGTADELLPGDSAWFLYLSEYTHGGGSATNTWIVQVELDGDGTWTIDAGTSGGSTNTGAVATNQWSELKFVADLDNDLIEVFYNGASMAPAYPISGGTFGGAAGPVALDVFDLYAPTSGPGSVAYYDDWLLEEQGSGGAACAPPPLNLIVDSDKSSYLLGEPIELTVLVDNPTGDTHSASAYAAGNLAVVAATRDGVPIPPTQTVVAYSQDPLVLQEEALTALAPGQQVQIPYDVIYGSSLGYRLSTPVLNTGAHHGLLVHTLSGPGTYVLRFSYQYTGPDLGFPNVYHGTLLSNEVTFDVQ